MTSLDPTINEILRLHCEGHSPAAIAAAVGWKRHQVTSKLKEIREEQREEREEMVQRTCDQLDYLYRRQLAPYCGVTKDGYDRSKDALPEKTAATLLKILDQKAKLLGLNSPVKSEVSLGFENLSEAELLDEAARLWGDKLPSIAPAE
jgi:hypothetical protein